MEDSKLQLPDRTSSEFEIATAATLALGSAISLEAENEAIAQMLGRALGYPETEQRKVDIGRQSARSIAAEAASRIAELEGLLAIVGIVDAVRTQTATQEGVNTHGY
jgi:hypothetical protein